MIAVIANRFGSTVQNLLTKNLPVSHIFLSKHHENKDNITITDDQELIFNKCRELNVKVIALAGYTKKIIVPEDFENKIVNIHPSLLPSFGGQGMYGINVHRKVIESGTKITGCTVHFVNNEYDKGTILAQNPVSINGENPEELQEKVKKEERKLYPAVLYLLIKGKLQNNQLVDKHLVRVSERIVFESNSNSLFKAFWE